MSEVAGEDRAAVGLPHQAQLAGGRRPRAAGPGEPEGAVAVGAVRVGSSMPRDCGGWSRGIRALDEGHPVRSRAGRDRAPGIGEIRELPCGAEAEAVRSRRGLAGAVPVGADGLGERGAMAGRDGRGARGGDAVLYASRRDGRRRRPRGRSAHEGRGGVRGGRDATEVRGGDVGRRPEVGVRGPLCRGRGAEARAECRGAVADETVAAGELRGGGAAGRGREGGGFGRGRGEAGGSRPRRMSWIRAAGPLPCPRPLPRKTIRCRGSLRPAQRGARPIASCRTTPARSTWRRRRGRASSASIPAPTRRGRGRMGRRRSR